jgi:hypothetical protein
MVLESQLPFRSPAPEVFEWVVAEFAWLGEGLRNVNFYGRRGQKQYGRDIVGTARDSKVVVYQVKRFQTPSSRSARSSRSTPARLRDDRRRCPRRTAVHRREDLHVSRVVGRPCAVGIFCSLIGSRRFDLRFHTGRTE